MKISICFSKFQFFALKLLKFSPRILERERNKRHKFYLIFQYSRKITSQENNFHVRKKNIFFSSEKLDLIFALEKLEHIHSKPEVQMLYLLS